VTTNRNRHVALDPSPQTDGFDPTTLTRPAATLSHSRGRGHREEGSAQWAGLYDRMSRHELDEVERRLELAADYGEPLSD
jgi:hypothetical protein